jgi:hypothetical protein
VTHAKGKRRGQGEDSIYWASSKSRHVGAVSLGFTSAARAVCGLSEAGTFGVCCGSDVWEAKHAERVAQTDEGGDGGNE